MTELEDKPIRFKDINEEYDKSNKRIDRFFTVITLLVLVLTVYLVLVSYTTINWNCMECVSMFISHLQTLN